MRGRGPASASSTRAREGVGGERSLEVFEPEFVGAALYPGIESDRAEFRQRLPYKRRERGQFGAAKRDPEVEAGRPAGLGHRSDQPGIEPERFRLEVNPDRGSRGHVRQGIDRTRD